MPNPLPPGLSARWLPGVVDSAPDLARSWELYVAAPAVLAAGGSQGGALAAAAAGGGLLAHCTARFLDCRNASQAKLPVYPDPTQPLRIPAVSCGGVSERVLRVYQGASCALWKENNTAGCWFNHTAQAFSGPGCVEDNATYCACSHLTGA